MFLTLRESVYEYIVPGFQSKPPVFSCLTNAIAPPPIALESCSNPQKIWQVFEAALEKIFFGWGCGFFVSDVASEVVL